MTADYKIIADYVQTLFSRFGIKLVNFIFFMVVAKHLSLVDMAAYGFFFSLSLIASVVLDGGSRNVIAKLIGSHANNFSGGLRYLNFFFIAIILILVTVYLFDFNILYYPALDDVREEFFLLVGSMTFIRMFQGVLLGKGLITKFNQSEMMSRLALLVMLVLMMANSEVTLTNACFSLAVAQLISAIFLFFVVNKLRGSDDVRMSKDDTLKLLRNGFLFMLTVFLMNISKQLHFYVLSGSDEALGGAFFSIYRICEIVTEIAIAISIVLFSRATNDTSSAHTIARISKATRLTVTMLTPALVFVLLFGELTVVFVLGAEYANYSEEFSMIFLASYIGVVWGMCFPSLSIIFPIWYLLVIFFVVNVLSLAAYYIVGIGVVQSAYVYMFTSLVTNIILLMVVKFTYGYRIRDFFIVRRDDFMPLISKFRRGV